MVKIGWDIGGAHLKAVMCGSENNVLQVLQVPCKLWLGLNELKAAIASVLAQCNIQHATNKTDVLHAVTMTGELVDLFQNRETGVIEIANLTTSMLGANTWFYTMQAKQQNKHFIQLESLKKSPQWVASANWHASANLVARHINKALILDIGSTTTDIIPIIDGQLCDVGLSDAERMQQDSLVYTGVIRTPVMVLAQKLMLNNQQINVAAEYFATTADVYRLTSELPTYFDMTDTADGENKSHVATARRLARMVGHDMEERPMASWKRLAMHCRELQLNQIQQAVSKHLAAEMPIIGAGAGAFLAKVLAKKMNREYIELSRFIDDQASQNVAFCLPAYAVACLLDQQ